jgi:hypothetical protein
MQFDLADNLFALENHHIRVSSTHIEPDNHQSLLPIAKNLAPERPRVEKESGVRIQESESRMENDSSFDPH